MAQYFRLELVLVLVLRRGDPVGQSLSEFLRRRHCRWNQLLDRARREASLRIPGYLRNLAERTRLYVSASCGEGGLYRHRNEHAGRCVDRSEDHTSELQSLMRSTYAGCCWKKKII